MNTKNISIESGEENFDKSFNPIKKFQKPYIFKSLFQVLFCLVSLISCYIAIYIGILHHLYWVFFLSPVATGLAIRTFTLQHDCGHGSLFRSPWANNFIGGGIEEPLVDVPWF